MTLINTVANLILFIFCVWAVLDLRVHTKLLGTVVLSLVGIFALLNIGQPTYFGMLPEYYTTGLSIALAIAAIWFWWRWEDPRKRERVVQL